MIPCKDCLLIPTCRCKSYRRLLNECCLLNEILYKEGTRIHVATRRNSGFVKNVYKIHRILRAVNWAPRVKNGFYDDLEILGNQAMRKLREKSNDTL